MVILVSGLVVGVICIVLELSKESLMFGFFLYMFGDMNFLIFVVWFFLFFVIVMIIVSLVIDVLVVECLKGFIYSMLIDE